MQFIKFLNSIKTTKNINILINTVYVDNESLKEIRFSQDDTVHYSIYVNMSTENNERIVPYKNLKLYIGDSSNKFICEIENYKNKENCYLIGNISANLISIITNEFLHRNLSTSIKFDGFLGIENDLDSFMFLKISDRKVKERILKNFPILKQVYYTWDYSKKFNKNFSNYSYLKIPYNFKDFKKLNLLLMGSQDIVSIKLPSYRYLTNKESINSIKKLFLPTDILYHMLLLSPSMEKIRLK